MVVIKVIGIIVLQVAEAFVMVNAIFLFCGFAGGVNHAQGEAHDKWPQLHPAFVETIPKTEDKKKIKQSLDNLSYKAFYLREHCKPNSFINTRERGKKKLSDELYESYSMQKPSNC